jgi:hypothetical protein
MKSISLKGSWIIKAPRSSVYNVMTDFEKMPEHFPEVARSFKIIKREGNDLNMEAELMSFGRAFQVKMTTHLRPPEGFISDNKNPALYSTGHEEFIMEEIPEGTRINYLYELNLDKWYICLLAKPLLQVYAMKYWERIVINKLKKMLE